MMQNNTAATQEEIPKFPRPQHSKWCQLLIYLGCISLFACGIVTLVFAFMPYKRLSHVFLALYLTIFGVVVILTELRIGFATRCFGFLCTQFGLGFFFIFAGTLGISFGVSLSVGVLVPFISGICWCAIGGLCITDSAVQAKSSTTTASVVEAV